MDKEFVQLNDEELESVAGGAHTRTNTKSSNKNKQKKQTVGVAGNRSALTQMQNKQKANKKNSVYATKQ